LPVSDFVQSAALKAVTAGYLVDFDRNRSFTITTESGACYWDSVHVTVEQFIQGIQLD